jgi:hypothetical protein
MLFGLVIRKVPAPLKANCTKVQGVVEIVHSPCCSDIVIQLEDNDKQYYINRGLDDGLDINQMRNDLLGKEIVLQKINHWTPLDPERYTIPLAELKVNDEVYFSRMLD